MDQGSEHAMSGEMAASPVRGASMEHWTAGDYGGAFAGVVAALAALGKGLAWLLNWQGAREDRRAQRNAEWEASLTRREKEGREQLEAKFAAIEGRVAQLETQNEALAVSLTDVTDELRRIEPASPVSSPFGPRP